MDHYNLGIVFGRLSKLERKKTKRGKPYMLLQLEIPESGYTMYGRVWGEERIQKILSLLHKDGSLMMGTPLKCKGFFSQYRKGGTCYSNYTFYECELYKGKDFRSVFVLTGDVAGIEKVENELMINLSITRNGIGEESVEEEFELFLDSSLCDELRMNDTVSLKGDIRAMEDYWTGELSVMPYVREVKVVSKGEEEPF